MRFAARLLALTLTFIEKFTVAFGALIFFLMAAIAFLNVILRYFFDISFIWEIEILGYMMAWTVFLGAGAVARENTHIKITFFAERVFGRQRAPMIWNTIENFVGVGVCGYLAYLAMRWIQLSYRTGEVSIGDITHPLWIPKLGVFVCMALLTLFYLERLVKQIKRQVDRRTGEQGQ